MDENGTAVHKIPVDDSRVLELLLQDHADSAAHRVFDMWVKKWRSVVVVCGLLIGLVAGSTGFWTVKSVRDLNAQFADIEKQKADLDEKISKAGELLVSTKSLTDSARSMLNGWATASALGLTSIGSMQSGLALGTDRLQEMIDSVNRKIITMSTDLSHTKSQLDITTRISDDVQKRADAVRVASEALQSQQKIVTDWSEISKRMLRDEAVTYIWMHQETESDTIRLPNVRDPQHGEYLLQLKIGDIKDGGADLQYRIRRPNEGWYASGVWIPLGRIRPFKEVKSMPGRQVLPIRETPYELRLEFLNKTSGRDFAAFRVQLRADSAALLLSGR